MGQKSSPSTLGQSPSPASSSRPEWRDSRIKAADLLQRIMPTLNQGQPIPGPAGIKSITKRFLHQRRTETQLNSGMTDFRTARNACAVGPCRRADPAQILSGRSLANPSDAITRSSDGFAISSQHQICDIDARSSANSDLSLAFVQRIMDISPLHW